MEKRGVREQIVLATKFTSPFRKAYEGKEIIVNSGGNGTKSLRSSLEMSLKNMKTSYIDLVPPPYPQAPVYFWAANMVSKLYVHYWDFSCSIPEMMQSLNDLVSSGKVNYLGVSDAPAWIVSKANQYARDHGLRQFVVYQGLWSAARRDFEREIIPMCVAEGMGLIPWGSLGMGQFKSEEQRKAPDGRTAFFPLTEPVIKVSEALEAVAKRKETEITSIALAYVMHKTPYVFPVIGGRNIGHLKGNIEALRVELEKEDVAEIEKATPFELGFPMDVLGTSAATNSGNLIGGQCDWMEELKVCIFPMLDIDFTDINLSPSHPTNSRANLVSTSLPV
jgi:aryl-alcohol dehydrogenase-like predicted oxidoreductase